MSDVTTERRRAVLLESALDREQQSVDELRRVGELTAIIDLLPSDGRIVNLDLEPTTAHVEPAKVERIVHNLLVVLQQHNGVS